LYDALFIIGLVIWCKCICTLSLGSLIWWKVRMQKWFTESRWNIHCIFFFFLWVEHACKHCGRQGAMHACLNLELLGNVFFLCTQIVFEICYRLSVILFSWIPCGSAFSFWFADASMTICIGLEWKLTDIYHLFFSFCYQGVHIWAKFQNKLRLTCILTLIVLLFFMYVEILFFVEDCNWRPKLVVPFLLMLFCCWYRFATAAKLLHLLLGRRDPGTVRCQATIYQCPGPRLRSSLHLNYSSM
jgi:hypothetical protein